MIRRHYINVLHSDIFNHRYNQFGKNITDSVFDSGSHNVHSDNNVQTVDTVNFAQ